MIQASQYWVLETSRSQNSKTAEQIAKFFQLEVNQAKLIPFPKNERPIWNLGDHKSCLKSKYNFAVAKTTVVQKMKNHLIRPIWRSWFLHTKSVFPLITDPFRKQRLDIHHPCRRSLIHRKPSTLPLFHWRKLFEERIQFVHIAHNSTRFVSGEVLPLTPQCKRDKRGTRRRTLPLQVEEKLLKRNTIQKTSLFFG